MRTHAPRHDHDSNEGDDQVTRMLPPVSDVRAQARPIQCPRLADASPTTADATASHSPLTADAVEQPRADVAIMALVEPIALELLGRSRHQRLVFVVLAALLEAREEEEVRYHSAAPAIQREE